MRTSYIPFISCAFFIPTTDIVLATQLAEVFTVSGLSPAIKYAKHNKNCRGIELANTGFVQSWEMSEVLKRLFSLLDVDSRKEVLRKVIIQEQLTPVIDVVIYCKKCKLPTISVTKNNMKLIEHYGSQLSVDILFNKKYYQLLLNRSIQKRANTGTQSENKKPKNEKK